MIVVAIIGILAAVAVPNFIALKDRALEASLKANMHTLQTTVEDFCSITDGAYPGDIDTKINQVNPDVLGAIGDKSLAAGSRVPPFPDDALLRAPTGFKNPFSNGNNVVDNLLVAKPPVPIAPSGCTYYSGYGPDGDTPTAGGGTAYSYIITAYGKSGPLSLTLP
jgi:type II secretory pathway pseudopilin PulG